MGAKVEKCVFRTNENAVEGEERPPRRECRRSRSGESGPECSRDLARPPPRIEVAEYDGRRIRIPSDDLAQTRELLPALELTKTEMRRDGPDALPAVKEIDVDRAARLVRLHGEIESANVENLEPRQYCVARVSALDLQRGSFDGLKVRCGSENL